MADENQEQCETEKLSVLESFLKSRLKRPEAFEAMSEEEKDDAYRQLSDSLKGLIIPVSVCMLMVLFFASNFAYFQKQNAYFIYTPFRETSSQTAVVRIGYAIANSLIIISVVVVATFVVILLFYYKCERTLKGWLVFSTASILILLSGTVLQKIIEQGNIPFDSITFCILIFNIGMMGLFAIHWKGPLIIQQFFNVFSSICMALTFVKYLPSWTSWVFLCLIAVYDILAVLCPGGPLNILVNLIQKRNTNFMEGMIYTTLIWMSVSDMVISSHGEDDDQQILTPNNVDGRTYVEEGEDEGFEFSGFKLGLGDFVFYSVLIGKASFTHDWNTIYSCYISIITGLTTTIIFLMLGKRALPALPFSVFMGLMSYFITFFCVTPMMEYFTHNCVFM